MRKLSWAFAAILTLAAASLAAFDIPYLWLEAPSGRSNPHDPKSPKYQPTPTLTMVPSGPTPDLFESDNIFSMADGISTLGVNQTHTLHVSADQDWLTFTATVGYTYTINTTNLIGGTDTLITVYDSAMTMLGYDDDGGPVGYESQFIFTATSNGLIYVKVSGGAASTYGTFSGYSINVSGAAPGSTATNTPSTTSTPPAGSTNTYTSTMTGTPPPGSTSTYTRTVTVTPTFTFTQTVTETNSPSPTSTATPTHTPTSSITPTSSVTPTNTPFAGSPTNTPTYTVTPSVTQTSTRTVTPTYTSTITPTYTITVTSTPTPTSSCAGIVYEDNEWAYNAPWGGGTWNPANFLNIWSVGSTLVHGGAYSWEFLGTTVDSTQIDGSYNPWFGFYDATSPNGPAPVGTACATSVYFWINSDTTFDMHVYITQGAGSNCDGQVWITLNPVTIPGDGNWHKISVPGSDMVYDGSPACPGLPIDFSSVAFPWWKVNNDIPAPGANFYIDEVGFE